MQEAHLFAGVVVVVVVFGRDQVAEVRAAGDLPALKAFVTLPGSTPSAGATEFAALAERKAKTIEVGELEGRPPRRSTPAVLYFLTSCSYGIGFLRQTEDPATCAMATAPK